MQAFRFAVRLAALVLSLIGLALTIALPLSHADPPGGTLRVRTAQAGMHRLSYEELIAAGVPPQADAGRFRMTYLDLPVQIRVQDADGLFDPGDFVVFYAEAYRGRYATDNVYFFHYGGVTPGERMAQRAPDPAPDAPVRSTITRTLRIEHDDAYFSDYPVASTADHFFASPVLAVDAANPVRTLSYNLPLQDAVQTGRVVVRGQFYGGASQAAAPDQSLAVHLNAHPFAVFTWDGRTGLAAQAAGPAGWLDAQPNVFSLETALAQLPGLSAYHVYVDWIEVDYAAEAMAHDDRLTIAGLDLSASDHAVQVEAAGFTTDDVQVYDIRDPRAPALLTAVMTAAADAGYKTTFRDAWDADAGPPAYYLTTRAALLRATSIEAAAAPPWRTPDNAYDYIAIVHDSLAQAVQPLLARRSAAGLRVAQVDVQDVYDLFSGGRMDPEALRAFISYAYHHWNGAGLPPRYLLLVGDGHYDFKGVTGAAVRNLIPPYLMHVDPWIGETAADNRYACVDGADDFLPDLAIGRIPAQTPAEVTAVVDKILRYEDATRAPGGGWQNRVTFIADQADDPAGNFQALSEQVRLATLPASVETRHLYWKTDYRYAYPANGTPDMNTAIKAAFTDSVMVQWLGHASKFRWGSTQVFSNGSIAALPSSTQWPLSVDYTCWTGYFTNLYDFYGDSRSLAEALVLTPGRGSVAAIAPSGLHVGGPLLILNEGLVKAIFQDGVHRVGDVLLAAKEHFYAHSAGSYDVLDTMLLLGDPALPLRLPGAAPNPPAITITAASAAIRLEWRHPDVTLTQYQAWRSEQPFFDPQAGEATQVGGYTFPQGLYGEYTAFAFTDDGAQGCFRVSEGAPFCQPQTPTAVVGDAAHNYFWLVRGGNAANELAESNRVGEFDFALVRGN